MKPPYFKGEEERNERHARFLFGTNSIVEPRVDERKPMSIKMLMHRTIRKTDPATTVGDTARLMRHYKVGSIFIEDGDRFVGVVTESALVRRVLTDGVTYRALVTDVMDAPLIVIDADQSAIEANHLMHFNGIRHLGVSEEGKIVGVISVRDLVRHFASDPDGPLPAMREVVRPLTILVHRDIQSIPASASARDTAQKMAEKKIGALMITETITGGRHYVGIVTETDLVRKVIGQGLDAADIRVGTLMTRPVLDIDISRSLDDANALMASSGVRHLAVSEGGMIVGILSIRDLIGMTSLRDLPRFFQQKREEEEK